MGSGCPTNTGLGVSARVSAWGARSGDPSPASLSQQPLGSVVSALPNTQLGHCTSDGAPTTL